MHLLLLGSLVKCRGILTIFNYIDTYAVTMVLMWLVF